MQRFILTALAITALLFFCQAGVTAENNKRFFDSKTLVRYYLPLYNASFLSPQNGWIIYPLDGGGAKLIHQKFESQINVNSYGINSAVNTKLTPDFWEKKTMQQFLDDYADFILDKTKNLEDKINITFHYSKKIGWAVFSNNLRHPQRYLFKNVLCVSKCYRNT
jgi:hypothetical protein